jgi:AraC family transcriptional regulator, arabinose operon regulatory protein
MSQEYVYAPLVEMFVPANYLDETLIVSDPIRMTIADGFPGERILVLPAPRVREALTLPGTSHLVVTDCGYFPQARSHGRVRSKPIGEAVIIVCAKGSGWCETLAGRFDVTAGQVVILPPGEPHSYAADDADPWTLWWLHVSGRDLPEFLTAAGMTRDAPVRNLSDPFGVITLVAEVLKWMERDTTTASLLASAGAAWHLMALLVSDRFPDDPRSNSLDEIADYIRDHIDERLPITELARRASLSPSHFATLFKKQFGVPVLQYQTQLRMARARKLLDTTERTIAEIASTVGYPDSFYFSRQFKNTHGLTATSYRNRHRG